jgi:hypothetical protein
MYTSVFSKRAVCPRHLIFLVSINLNMLAEQFSYIKLLKEEISMQSHYVYLQ